MFFSIIFNALGVLLFLFLLWKKLREDYPSNQIFTVGIFSLLGLLIFNIPSNSFIPEWWFFATFAGSFLGLLIGVLKYKLRFYETYEAYVASILPITSFMFLVDSVRVRSIVSFIYFVFTVVLMGVFYIFDKHYKKFTWYRSGRIGFTGLSVTGIFFLVRAVVASFFSFVISFVDKFESIVSGIIAFIFFLLVFNLARQKA